MVKVFCLGMTLEILSVGLLIMGDNLWSSGQNYLNKAQTPRL